MYSTILLIVFVVCALIYGRATTRLRRLEQMRLDYEYERLPVHERPEKPNLGTRLYMRVAPGGADLEKFCAEHGHAVELRNANRLLYGAIFVSFACIFVIAKFGAQMQ
jgi:hypothetical protein